MQQNLDIKYIFLQNTFVTQIRILLIYIHCKAPFNAVDRLVIKPKKQFLIIRTRNRKLTGFFLSNVESNFGDFE